MPLPHEELLPGLHRFVDTCNVYLVCSENESLAIDFGSGDWLDNAASLGLPPVKHVLLTHHHADQCHGLLTRRPADAIIHAPVNERAFLSPEGVAAFWKERNNRAWPASYSVLPEGLPDVQYDLSFAGDWFWADWRRVRCLETPGHGRGAASILIDHDDKQVLFCGDAAHAGATIHEPYHLEWDHWTGEGALAAWHGIRGIWAFGIDLLCPSHGPVIDDSPRATLDELSTKLLELVEVKGNICPGEYDRYITPSAGPAGSRQVSESVIQLGQNGYLILGDDKQALGLDPMATEIDEFEAVLKGLGDYRLTHLFASHFHIDHVDGLLAARERFGADIVLHELVAEPLRDPYGFDAPWQPPKAIVPQVTISDGTFHWNRYTFEVAHYPGQTWWHVAMIGKVDGQSMLFGGDNFQPNSRYNATGGFCAYNGCRFEDGFRVSAKQALAWSPDIVLNGHQTYHHFAASQYEKIISWSERAQAAVQALCPDGDMQRHYLRELGPAPWPHAFTPPRRA